MKLTVATLNHVAGGTPGMAHHAERSAFAMNISKIKESWL